MTEWVPYASETSVTDLSDMAGERKAPCHDGRHLLLKNVATWFTSPFAASAPYHRSPVSCVSGPIYVSIFAYFTTGYPQF